MRGLPCACDVLPCVSGPSLFAGPSFLVSYVGCSSDRPSGVDPELPGPNSVLEPPSSLLLFSLFPVFSFLPLHQKFHFDHGFKNHLNAKDSKNYSSSLTSVQNPRPVHLTAYSTSFLLWMSSGYFKHTQPCQNTWLSLPLCAPHPALLLEHSFPRKIPLVTQLFRTQTFFDSSLSLIRTLLIHQ